jgi:endoglucanase
VIPLLSHFRRLSETPTAPFREEWILEVLDEMLAQIPDLERQVDEFGNRIVRLRRGQGSDPQTVFVAHVDHPGFIFDEHGATVLAGSPPGKFRYLAQFEGRVDDRFFPQSAVRLYRHTTDEGVAGRILKLSAPNPVSDERFVEIETDIPADGAMLAMWDVPSWRLDTDGIISGRACDDLGGVAAIISALEELSAGDTENLDVACIFSRAEEAGFCGVLCMLNEDQLPSLIEPDAIFVSVEISSERPGVELGGGAIIRVGDRSSTFDGLFADALWAVVRERNLHAKRALMDGGTCEATAFGARGYRTGGVCAPVRHYHNMDKSSGRIVPEQVHLSDVQALGSLIVGIARHIPEFGLSRPKPLCDLDAFLVRGLAGLPRLCGR